MGLTKRNDFIPMKFLPAAPSDFAATWSRALRLGPAQRAQLRAIVAAEHAQFDAVSRQAQADSGAAQERLHRQIRPLLRLEQLKRFDALLALRGAWTERPAAQ